MEERFIMLQYDSTRIEKIEYGGWIYKSKEEFIITKKGTYNLKSA